MPPVIRILPDGTRDKSFNLTGREGNVGIAAIAVSPTGEVYVAQHHRIWRTLPNGELDPTFTVGVPAPNSPDRPGIIKTIALAGNTVYVGGAWASFNGVENNGLVRLLANGSVDTSFNYSGGYTRLILPMALRNGRDRLYVMHYVQYSPGGFAARVLRRFTPDGALDQSMAPVDFHRHGSSSVRTEVRALEYVLDSSNGDIMCGGAFIVDGQGGGNPLLDPTAIRSVARINPDGSVDRMEPRPLQGEEQSVTAMKQLPPANRPTDFAWVVAAHRLVRMFMPNGSEASNFVRGQTDGRVNSILPLGNGDIIVAGEFTTYNGEPHANIVRLQLNGTRR